MDRKIKNIMKMGILVLICMTIIGWCNISLCATSKENNIKSEAEKYAKDIDLNNINKEDKLSEISMSLNKTFESSSDVINYIVECLNSAKNYDQLYALENLGVIKINNLDEKKYQDYDSVVLLGELTGKDAKIKFDQKEKIILNKLKENNKYLVAANQSESDNTILKLYSENNISTIDNINEGIGKVSLTNLLKNQNVVGHYGTSDVSTEIIAYEK